MSWRTLVSESARLASTSLTLHDRVPGCRGTCRGRLQWGALRGLELLLAGVSHWASDSPSSAKSPAAGSPATAAYPFSLPANRNHLQIDYYTSARRADSDQAKHFKVIESLLLHGHDHAETRLQVAHMCKCWTSAGKRTTALYRVSLLYADHNSTPAEFAS